MRIKQIDEEIALLAQEYKKKSKKKKKKEQAKIAELEAELKALKEK